METNDITQKALEKKDLKGLQGYYRRGEDSDRLTDLPSISQSALSSTLVLSQPSLAEWRQTSSMVAGQATPGARR